MQDRQPSSAAESVAKRERRLLFGPFRFDSNGPLLSKNGISVRLGPRPLAVLECLLERPGTVVTKQHLMDRVWNETSVTEHSLVQAIKTLRKVLGDDPDNPTYIETAHWRGYRFIAPVSVDGRAGHADGPSSERRGVLTALASAAAYVARAVSQQKQLVLWSLVTLAVGSVAGGLWVSRFGNGSSLPESAPPAITRFPITFERGQFSGNWSLVVLAISPDGGTLVYRGFGPDAPVQLFLRRLDSLEREAIPGTEGAAMAFFSPDGEWLGFVRKTPSSVDPNRRAPQISLQRIRVAGGEVVTLVADAALGSAMWGHDGTIVFSRREEGDEAGLWRVDADGNLEQLTRVDKDAGERAHEFPATLPSGRGILFTLAAGRRGDGPAAEQPEPRVDIAVLSLRTGEYRTLIEGGIRPLYASRIGRIIFAQEGRLMSVPFNQERLELMGEPTLALENVFATSEVAQFALSDTGTLAYVPGGLRPDDAHFPVWVDLHGEPSPLLPESSESFVLPRLSPDGRRVALVTDTSYSDIYVYDIERGTYVNVTERADSAESYPVWSPDGTRLAFSSDRAGTAQIYIAQADGTGEVDRLLESPYEQRPTSWSTDDVLVYWEVHPETGYDIWTVDLASGQAPRPFASTAFHEVFGRFSPDGRWIAYLSNETGPLQIYLQDFPGQLVKLPVSASPAADWTLHEPIWSADGSELFYRVRHHLMAVSLEDGPELRLSPPRELFDLGRVGPAFDLTPDGEHFLMTRTVYPPSPEWEINIVMNWFEELKRRVPTGR